MKTITLIRHGKASQDFSYQDFDRPLLALGIDNNERIANEFRYSYAINSVIWSSAAQRAKQTAIIFANCLKVNTNEILFKSELYTFDAEILVEIIKTCNDEIENLILFGHNSAITDFVNTFGSIYIDNVSTSGLVSIKFETNNWATISKGTTTLTLFTSQF